MRDGELHGSYCGEMEEEWDTNEGETRAGFWLGKRRRSLEGNATKYVTDAGCQCVEWVCLALGRDKWLSLVNTAGNFSTSLNDSAPWNSRDHEKY